MEYALLVLYYGIQKLFNTFMNIEVAPNVSVGGIFVVLIILSIIFASFGFISSGVNTNVPKSGKRFKSKEE